MKHKLRLAGIASILALISTASFAQLAKPNPFLAADQLAITHVDSSQSDSFAHTLPQGTFNIDLDKTPMVAGGPINIMTLASTSSDYMWGVSSGGVTYIDKSGSNWKEVARATIPGVKSFNAEFNKKAIGKVFKSIKDVENVVKNVYQLNGFERISNGIYSLVDKDNLVYANYGRTIYVFGLVEPNNPAAGIKILRSIDFDTISKNDTPAGLSITYDGYLIMLGHRSLVVMNRELKGTPSRMTFNKDEYISNSLAVDENNGIYVASDKMMHKIIWTGTKLSNAVADGAWTAAYDTGEQPPVVKFGTGTGSTPTLMGFDDSTDKLVVITDGANRMKLVAFWRNDIPKDFVQQSGTKSKRIAGQIQVTCGFKKFPKFIQSEQSVVVKDFGAFVVNNIGTQGSKDLLVGVMALGPIFPPPHGVERFEWDSKQHKWRSVWANAVVVSTSMVPVVSIPSNIVVVNGYSKESGWEVTGMDWNTGKIVHRTIFGQTNYGNGAYALLEIYPDNNLIFNSIAGPFRIQY